MHVHDCLIESITSLWVEVREYAQRLVADLSDDDMVSQPAPGVTMNHPAWILSHLGAYGPVLAGALRGEPVEDPLHHKHGRLSSPLAELGAYLPRLELYASFAAVYDDAAEALRTASPERLLEPTPIVRWRKRFPVIGAMPAQFMLKHTSTHLGQLSAWRRAGGRPAV